MVTPATVPVVCCGCTQQCGLLAHVADGRVVELRGDRAHPVSAGYLCPKGKDATDFLYHPDRLLGPKRRVGPRGSGRFEDVGWDEALDDIAARLKRVVDTHGARAVAYSYGTFRGGDWGIGERFMNRLGSPNSCGQDKICYGPLALAETLTYGTGPTVFTAPVAGLTRCVVLWGMRPAESAPLLWRAIRAAHKAGATLVVIDPAHTQEAREADLWLQPLPGRDTELALALLKWIIEGGHYDRDFVRTETTGFDALAAHLASQPIAALATACGVPLARIEQAAALVAARHPAVFNAGNGLCQSGTPVVQVGRAIACLVALTGNLGVPGGHALLGPPRDLRANGAMLDAAWELGAWDMERSVRRGCNDAGASAREAHECRQAFGDNPLAPDSDAHLVAEAPDRDELMQLAARRGYVRWLFRPVRAGLWRAIAEDDTLDADGGRTPPCPVAPRALGEPQRAPVVYRLGRITRIVLP